MYTVNYIQMVKWGETRPGGKLPPFVRGNSMVETNIYICETASFIKTSREIYSRYFSIYADIEPSFPDMLQEIKKLNKLCFIGTLFGIL